MFTSLSIEGYRGFRKFSMSGLGRVNLLVGTNNSGKTSVLEAIHLLASSGDPEAIWQLLSRRGEQPAATATHDVGQRTNGPSTSMEVSHLFTGHYMQVGSSVAISSHSDMGGEWVTLRLAERRDSNQEPMFEIGPGHLRLEIISSRRGRSLDLPISRQGALSYAALEIPPRNAWLKESYTIASEFITTESHSASQLITYWNQIALTPEEDLVNRALRFIDPLIERIAPQIPATNSFASLSRGGFAVKMKDIAQPVPIGSMGDGIWRMLALAMAITQCKGGVLLVDEIDTGLHFRVMAKMWNLIFNAAKEFNVQVFATTHSYDCVYSLAQIEQSGDPTNRVTVQRIEAGRERSIPYDETEISVAADRSIEMR